MQSDVFSALPYSVRVQVAYPRVFACKKRAHLRLNAPYLVCPHIVLCALLYVSGR